MVCDKLLFPLFLGLVQIYRSVKLCGALGSVVILIIARSVQAIPCVMRRTCKHQLEADSWYQLEHQLGQLSIRSANRPLKWSQHQPNNAPVANVY